MNVRDGSRPESPTSGQTANPVTSLLTSSAGLGRDGSMAARQSTSPPDIVSPESPSASTACSLAISSSTSTHVGRSVPRDDSGLSIASLGRGRPSDSGYGTDSPASLGAGALRFHFENLEYTDEPLSPPGAEPDDLNFDFDLHDTIGSEQDDEEEDDDVFLDVVPEEEIDGDDDDVPAFPRQPTGRRRDVVDGVWRSQGGSDGQTDTSTETEEDEDLHESQAAGSNPITIPRHLRTEGLEYAVALAHPSSSSGYQTRGRAPGSGSAIVLARGSVRQDGARWSIAQAFFHSPNMAPSALAILTSTPQRNSYHCVARDGLGQRRFSDSVDPSRLLPGYHHLQDGGASSSPMAVPAPRSGGGGGGGDDGGHGAGALVPHGVAEGRPRCRSESTVMERELGRELRRISDLFHQSYQRGPENVQSRSLPERNRRSSIFDRLRNMVSSLTAPDPDVADRGGIRRRAYSEATMAPDLPAMGAGHRRESLPTNSFLHARFDLIGTGAAAASSSTSTAEDDDGQDVIDGSHYMYNENISYDDDDSDQGAIFMLSTDQ